MWVAIVGCTLTCQCIDASASFGAGCQASEDMGRRVPVTTTRTTAQLKAATHLLKEVFAVYTLRRCRSTRCSATQTSIALDAAVRIRCPTACVAGSHDVLIALPRDRRSMHTVCDPPARAAPTTAWLLRWRRVVMHEVGLVQGVGMRCMGHRGRHRITMGARVRRISRPVSDRCRVRPMSSGLCISAVVAKRPAPVLACMHEIGQHCPQARHRAACHLTGCGLITVTVREAPPHQRCMERLFGRQNMATPTVWKCTTM